MRVGLLRFVATVVEAIILVCVAVAALLLPLVYLRGWALCAADDLERAGA